MHVKHLNWRYDELPKPQDRRSWKCAATLRAQKSFGSTNRATDAPDSSEWSTGFHTLLPSTYWPVSTNMAKHRPQIWRVGDLWGIYCLSPFFLFLYPFPPLFLSLFHSSLTWLFVRCADVVYYSRNPFPCLNLITHVYICVCAQARNLFVCLVMDVWLKTCGHE